MKVAIIPPAFAPYKDHSEFSTVYMSGQIADYLLLSGWDVKMLVLSGSSSQSLDLIQHEGLPQPSILDDVVHETNSGLTNILETAVKGLDSGAFDVVLNFGHDALPMQLALDHRILNAISFCHGVDNSIDHAISLGAFACPERFGFISSFQAGTYGAAELDPLLCPIASDTFTHTQRGDGSIMFAGRVTRSKGIMNAIKVARHIGCALKVAGTVDPSIADELASDSIQVLGCLPRQELMSEISKSSVFVQLQMCAMDEAFGIVTAEALSCGVPVVTWPCGANEEIVTQDDGIVVRAGSIRDAIEAVESLSHLSIEKREDIRRRNTKRFSLPSVGERYKQWIEKSL